MLALATWNVKDLFGDAGKNAYVVERLGRFGADVVALQEIGNEGSLREIATRAGYAPPIFATADARGIRNAALVRPHVPVNAWRVHTAAHLDFPRFDPADPSPFGERIPLRRGVLHLEIGGELPFHLFVVHFKSGRPVPRKETTARALAEGELLALVWRSCEALHVRGLVDDVLAESPNANVVVAGDFNDAASSVVVRSVAAPTSENGALVAVADRVPPAARWSILVRGERRHIDHVLASRALAERVQSAKFENEGLLDHTAFAENAPTPALPDSDHAAFVVRW